jgi:hypothetical protein
MVESVGARTDFAQTDLGDLINSHIVLPAEAGTQATQALLDPRLRGDDI